MTVNDPIMTFLFRRHQSLIDSFSHIYENAFLEEEDVSMFVDLLDQSFRHLRARVLLIPTSQAMDADFEEELMLPEQVFSVNR